jgi:EAL domain-containing protein (putative c-di-GMP-specific phosphodiesterase class I)
MPNAVYEPAACIRELGLGIREQRTGEFDRLHAARLVELVAVRLVDLLPFAFTMAFQPILDVSQNRIWGYEALVRGEDGQGS